MAGLQSPAHLKWLCVFLLFFTCVVWAENTRSSDADTAADLVGDSYASTQCASVGGLLSSEQLLRYSTGQIADTGASDGQAAASVSVPQPVLMAGAATSEDGDGAPVLGAGSLNWSPFHMSALAGDGTVLFQITRPEDAALSAADSPPINSEGDSTVDPADTDTVLAEELQRSSFARVLDAAYGLETGTPAEHAERENNITFHIHGLSPVLLDELSLPGEYQAWFQGDDAMPPMLSFSAGSVDLESPSGTMPREQWEASPTLRCVLSGSVQMVMRYDPQDYANDEDGEQDQPDGEQEQDDRDEEEPDVSDTGTGRAAALVQERVMLARNRKSYPAQDVLLMPGDCLFLPAEYSFLPLFDQHTMLTLFLTAPSAEVMQRYSSTERLPLSHPGWRLWRGDAKDLQMLLLAVNPAVATQRELSNAGLPDGADSTDSTDGGASGEKDEQEEADPWPAVDVSSSTRSAWAAVEDASEAERPREGEGRDADSEPRLYRAGHRQALDQREKRPRMEWEDEEPVEEPAEPGAQSAEEDDGWGDSSDQGEGAGGSFDEWEGGGAGGDDEWSGQDGGHDDAGYPDIDDDNKPPPPPGSPAAASSHDEL